MLPTPIETKIRRAQKHDQPLKQIERGSQKCKKAKSWDQWPQYPSKTSSCQLQLSTQPSEIRKKEIEGY